MKEKNSPPGSNAVAAKSPRKKKVNRQSWDAGMWVEEFLREHPGATEKETVAVVLHRAPHLSLTKITDALHNPGRFRRNGYLPASGASSMPGDADRADGNNKL